MDFSLSDDQLRIRELAHAFAAAEIAPVAGAHDRDATHPASVVERAWELDLLNPHLPARLGGAELGAIEVALLAEEFGWACAGIATTLVDNSLASLPLLLSSNRQVADRYLRRLAEAPRLAAFCLTEPEAGSDVAGLRTRAERCDAGWRLTGAKAFITNGSHADFYVVFATVDPDARHRGVAAFVVPRDAGVSVVRKEDKAGQRASDTAALALDHVEVPDDHVLALPGEGFGLAMATLDRFRVTVAAVSVGVARAALERAVAYTREREQFGGPVARNQGVSFLLADMATAVECSRLLTWHAAWLQDAGQTSALAASHAKRMAADTAMAAAVDAVQLHGGYGVMREFGVEKLMRDAKVLQLYEGTSQIQRVVIARELLRVSTAPSVSARRTSA